MATRLDFANEIWAEVVWLGSTYAFSILSFPSTDTWEVCINNAETVKWKTLSLFTIIIFWEQEINLYLCSLLRLRDLSVTSASVTLTILQLYEVYITNLMFSGNEARAHNDEITWPR